MTSTKSTAESPQHPAQRPDLLDRVISDPPADFALIYRPQADSRVIEVLIGEATEVGRLADLALPARNMSVRGGHELLALIPYRQLAERGFDVHLDDSSLLALAVAEQGRVALDEAVVRLPEQTAELTDPGFDVPDAEYARTVQRIIDHEIGSGEGANFVIRRSFTAEIADWNPRLALACFRRLLTGERSAYWTFLIHIGGRTLIGASPERQISLDHGNVVMNPISGTYRYPTTGPDVRGALEFLADAKESDELYMVVDEELKMMAQICPDGGRVIGPGLREMARVAHTEYYIEGTTDRNVHEMLRATMFAPTVTGSPLESACRVIKRYEPRGRGYYSGVAALIGRGDDGERTLDSAILIRTAQVDASGRLDIGVGATLVRHSDPLSEVAETAAKAESLLAALTGAPAERTAPGVPYVMGAPLQSDERVAKALAARNHDVAAYWFATPADRSRVPRGDLAGRRILVIDAEDTFTAMLACQLRSMGLEVEVRRFDEPYTLAGVDIVLVGPGPGDPRDVGHPKIAQLRGLTRRLLARGTPFLSVCLGHQVLSTLLGFEIVRRERPNQGVQRKIDLFDRTELVGFYNTFAAHSETDSVLSPNLGGLVEVSRDAETGEVHGLRGPTFRSVQFHPESLLTQDGPRILGDLIADLITAPV